MEKTTSSAPRPLPALVPLLVALALAITPGTGAAAGNRPQLKILHKALQQGGFVVGQVTGQPAINAVVSFNGQTVPVMADGMFVVGFDRFQKNANTLKACLPDKKAESCTTQTLTVAQRSYKVQRVTNVPQKTVEPNPEETKQVEEDNKITAQARATAWQQATQAEGFAGGFRLPVKGPTSGVFGSRRTYNGQERSWHRGHDLAAPTGTPVYAPAAGVVRMARPTFMSGNLLMLDHGGGLTTVYAHLSEMEVENGQTVTAGERIGRVGTTGRSSGPHLHWGMYWQNTPLDPILWVAGGNAPAMAQPGKATGE